MFYRSRYWKNHKKFLMTNDLNGHEQWRTYGIHLHVTYEVHLYVTYGVLLHVTHWGYDYMSLIEGQGVRLPILLEFS